MKKHQYIIITIEYIQEKDKTWLARCQELGTSTFGDSFEEVEAEIEELVELHLKTLAKVGERERFFKENNITIYSYIPEDIEVKTPVRKDTYINTYAQELAFA